MTFVLWTWVGMSIAIILSAYKSNQKLRSDLYDLKSLNADLSLQLLKYPQISYETHADGLVVHMWVNGKKLPVGTIPYSKLPITQKPQSQIWHVLGIMPTTDRNAVISAYRKMSMVYHPDCGGDAKAFETLTNAKEKALLKCK